MGTVKATLEIANEASTVLLVTLPLKGLSSTYFSKKWLQPLYGGHKQLFFG